MVIVNGRRYRYGDREGIVMSKVRPDGTVTLLLDPPADARYPLDLAAPGVSVPAASLEHAPEWYER